MAIKSRNWFFAGLAVSVLLGIAAGSTAGGWLDISSRGVTYGIPAAYSLADHTLGVNVDLAGQPHQTRAAFWRQIEEFAPGQVVWIRQTISWRELAGSAPGGTGGSTAIPAGIIDWSALEALIDEANSGGFKVLAVLKDSPDWSRDPYLMPSAPPRDVRAFGGFARAVAARFKGRIAAYQIWDEPNLRLGWGGLFPDAVQYGALLREAAINIRTVDPTAKIVSAALAPTVEQGPLNVNEPAFLRQLYRANSGDFFDAVGAQPFGFSTGPDDRRVDAAVLNFSRLILLREVMVAHGDGAKTIWASAFGWPVAGARGTAFQGDAAPVQASRTLAAIRRARDEWPWLGPLMFTRWTATRIDDERAGFALIGVDGIPTPMLLGIQSGASTIPVATVGRYAANHASAQFPASWRVTAEGADAPENDTRPVTIRFRGTRIDLTVRRGLFQALLFVSVDGAPANALPREQSGRSYVVLFDPLAQTVDVSLASGLDDEDHVLEIVPEGGWGQWAIVGWVVAREPSGPGMASVLGAGLGALALGLLWLAAGRAGTAWPQALSASLDTRPSSTIGGREWLLGFGAVALLYLSPHSALSWAIIGTLGVLIVMRLEIGLALVAFAIPFYLQPKPLGAGSFSIVEIVVLSCLASFIVTQLRSRPEHSSNLTAARSPATSSRAGKSGVGHQLRTAALHLRPLDWVVALWVTCGTLGVLSARIPGVATREFRVVFAEPALYYLLIRASGTNPRLLINAYLAGAAVVAAKAITDWIGQRDLIMVEGVMRSRSVYFSPNNLALYLDRAVPIALSLSLFGKSHRAAYAFTAVLLIAALYLTFAKGSWLVALPGALLSLGLLGGRRILAASLMGLLLLALSLLPWLGTERIQSIFDLESGTSSIRLQLWQSSLAMIRDHPLWGVGLDNFLYQYRTRYILPTAFAETSLSHPHNFVLDFWTRLGLPGLLLLAMLLFTFWRGAMAHYRRLPEGDKRALTLGLMASMVAAVGHGLIDNSFFLVDLAYVLMLALAAVEDGSR